MLCHTDWNHFPTGIFACERRILKAGGSKVTEKLLIQIILRRFTPIPNLDHLI